MMMKRVWIVGALLALISGCQSKADALEVICQAPVNSDCQGRVEWERPRCMAEYIEDNISNGEVEELFAALARADTATRRALLQAQLTEAGITSCPMLDVFAPEDTPAE